jgi:serine protease Do
LATLQLGNSDSLKPGQLVIAIGTPLGEYAGSVTTGVVSGLNRSVTAGSQGFWGIAKTYEDVIQTDAAVNPGNSGGPLLNSSGEVIGVNFATTSVAENISFALPANFVSRRLDEYRKYGKFMKPYLGVEYQMISEQEAMIL